MLLTLPLLATARANPPLPLALDKAVKSLITLLSDSSVKASPARLLRMVSLDEGGPEDYALVSFTLSYFGGGNEYYYYLAAFEAEQPENAKQPLRYRLVASVAVGGKAWRSVDLEHLRYADGRIEFDTKEYRDGEPFCCPSKPAKTVYRLDRFRLREIDARLWPAPLQ